jgi:hypothetical protein
MNYKGLETKRMHDLKAAFDHIFEHITDHLVCGPLMDPPDGKSGWAMIVGGGGAEFHIDLISLVDLKNHATDLQDCEYARRLLIVELAQAAQKHFPVVPRIHVFDDELLMARWVAREWLSDYTATILKKVERRYAENAKGAH